MLLEKLLEFFLYYLELLSFLFLGTANLSSQYNPMSLLLNLARMFARMKQPTILQISAPSYAPIVISKSWSPFFNQLLFLLNSNDMREGNYNDFFIFLFDSYVSFSVFNFIFQQFLYNGWIEISLNLPIASRSNSWWFDGFPRERVISLYIYIKYILSIHSVASLYKLSLDALYP